MIRIKRKILRKRISIISNNLGHWEIEEKGMEMLEKGYIVKRGIYIDFFGNWKMDFKLTPSVNSPYLKLKRLHRKVANTVLNSEQRSKK